MSPKLFWRSCPCDRDFDFPILNLPEFDECFLGGGTLSEGRGRGALVVRDDELRDDCEGTEEWERDDEADAGEGRWVIEDDACVNRRLISSRERRVS